MTNTTLLNKIEKKQAAHKRLMRMRANRNLRLIRKEKLQMMIEEGQFPLDQTARMIGKGYYKAQKKNQAKAQEILKKHTKGSAHFTEFEWQKAIEAASQEFVQNITEEDECPEDANIVYENSWVTPTEKASVDRILAQERKERTDEWYELNVANRQKYKDFYTVAKIDNEYLTVDLDTREFLWTRDEKGKPIKTPSRCTSNNYYEKETRVINDIIKAFYKDGLPEDFPSIIVEALTKPQRDAELAKIEEITELKLMSGYALVKSVHRGGLNPCLFFTMESHLSRPTKYSYSEHRGLHKLSDEELEIVPDPKNVLELAPISSYELENLAIQGKLDEASSPIKRQGWEERGQNERGVREYGIELDDMQPGHAGYVQLMMENEKQDLAQNANIVYDPISEKRNASIEMNSALFEELKKTYKWYILGQQKQPEYDENLLAFGKTVVLRNIWDEEMPRFNQEEAAEIANWTDIEGNEHQWWEMFQEDVQTDDVPF